MTLRKKLRMLVFLSVICIVFFAFAGCLPGAEPEPEPEPDPDPALEPEPEPEPEPGLSGSITVAGSTSVAPLVEILAEAFAEKHPGVTIASQSIGSSAGVENVGAGVSEIGTTSRNLRGEEKELNLNEFVVAKDGIAVVVHPANEVADLTIEEIRKIYLKEIINWKDVGGPDASITVVTREEGSGTRGAFEDIVMDDEPINPAALVQKGTGAVRAAVAGDENAIGYVSIAAITEAVKAVQVDGVAATPENVLDGAYGIARPFILLTKGEPTGIAEAFIDFALGPDGQDIVEEEDLVRID